MKPTKGPTSEQNCLNGGIVGEKKKGVSFPSKRKGKSPTIPVNGGEKATQKSFHSGQKPQRPKVDRRDKRNKEGGY